MKITSLFIALLLFCCGCAPMIPYRQRPTLMFEVGHPMGDDHSDIRLRNTITFQV